MQDSRLGSGLKRWFVYALVVAIGLPIVPVTRGADQKIDLDGNPFNGAESSVETNVLQSFPVEVENVIFNNTTGAGYRFRWPGAGPGGFESIVTSGPAVGTKWTWTTVSQVFTVTSDASFQPDSREVPVFGGPVGMIQASPGNRTFAVPGKSIFPSQVTVSSASLTSSLVTFFSPENTIATCDSKFVPGRFEQTITNNTGETVTFMVEEPDCCPEPQMTICEDGCQFFLTDVNNCGGCGMTCEFDQVCDQGSCTDICPGPTDEYCNDVCVETSTDVDNCGGCGITCEFDQFCDQGICADICPGPTDELCDDVCVDTAIDDNNCGDCGVTCAFDEFCGGGICADICPGVGQAYCSEVCVDTLNDVTNCGLCGITCEFDQFCDQGSCADICPGPTDELCNGVCAETSTDVENCGGCGITCEFDQFCDQGSCADICPGPTDELCNGVCAETSTDVENCGGCGITCEFDQFCDLGTCADICPDSTLCGSDCADLQNDPSNCGSCGNVCEANSICTGGQCEECRPPLRTNCDNECVNTNTDPYNCGDCGMVCDFSNCPSTGQGTCSQGSSCVCDAPPTAAEETLGFSPVETEPPTTVYSVPALQLGVRATSRTSPGVADRSGHAGPGLPPGDALSGRRPSGSLATPEARSDVDAPTARATSAASGRKGRDRTRHARPELLRRDDVQGRELSESAAALNVVEAPVCGIAPIMQEIPDGESFTICQSGSLVGREIFTTATVMMGGETVGQGPCALIVPADVTTIGVFEPSPVSLILQDETGDGLLQPGESATAKIEVLNLGTGELLNPVAVLSSPPDALNPIDMPIVGDTILYPDFPALTSPADCDTEPVLEPQMPPTEFAFTVPLDQEPDVSRVFKVNFQGDAGGLVSVDMPIVIGVGRVCDPATDLDGETYDGLAGLLSPVNAKLAPKTYPVNFAPGTFNNGSNVPLKLKLKCGAQVLSGAEIELAPQIVSLVHETIGELPLANINANNNSNPNDPFFECGTNRCEFGLRTAGLPVGDVVISIRMPDSRVFKAGITTVP